MNKIFYKHHSSLNNDDILLNLKRYNKKSTYNIKEKIIKILK